MKAVVVDQYGAIELIRVKDLALPVLQSNEVSIKVSYAGVNFPDTLIIKGLYQFKPDLPFIPGGEISGIVTKVGANVHSLKLGDRVMAANSWGGFAEEVNLPEFNCFKISGKVTLQKAAVLLETYATALYALKDRCALKKGERLLVLGASGGTGLAAIQIGKLLGAEVYACASNMDKLNFCRENGADYGLNYVDSDFKNQLKETGGMDVVFDPVGGTVSELAFRSLRPNGRHLVVGFASGQIPAIPWNLPLLKSASIVGVFWGGFWRNFPEQNRENVDQLLQWTYSAKINPAITAIYEIEETYKALKAIEERRILGKSIIRFAGGS